MSIKPRRRQLTLVDDRNNNSQTLITAATLMTTSPSASSSLLLPLSPTATAYQTCPYFDEKQQQMVLYGGQRGVVANNNNNNSSKIQPSTLRLVRNGDTYLASATVISPRGTAGGFIPTERSSPSSSNDLACVFFPSCESRAKWQQLDHSPPYVEPVNSNSTDDAGGDSNYCQIGCCHRRRRKRPTTKQQQQPSSPQNNDSNHHQDEDVYVMEGLLVPARIGDGGGNNNQQQQLDIESDSLDNPHSFSHIHHHRHNYYPRSMNNHVVPTSSSGNSSTNTEHSSLLLSGGGGDISADDERDDLFKRPPPPPQFHQSERQHRCAGCGLVLLPSSPASICTVCDLMAHRECEDYLVTVECVPSTYQQQQQQQQQNYSGIGNISNRIYNKPPPRSRTCYQQPPLSSSINSRSNSTPFPVTGNNSNNNRQQQITRIVNLSSTSSPPTRRYIVNNNNNKRMALTPAEIEKQLVTSYVTDHIVAIHFATNSHQQVNEDAYGAAISNAVALVRQHHGTDNVLIVNVSGPRPELSGINVKQLDASWPADLGPPLERLCSICKSIDLFLSEDSQHVIALHCKGAVGRLATVLLAYARYLDICTASDTQLMEQLAIKTFCDSIVIRDALTPSQLRYVRYFDGLLTGDIQINANPSYLHHIVISRLPPDATALITGDDASSSDDVSKGLSLYLKVYQGLNLVYTSGIFMMPVGSGRLVVSPEAPLLLRGDVVIRCYHLKEPERKLPLFNCQIHMAAFAATTLSFKRIDLDYASKNMKLATDFQLELVFSPSPQQLVGVQSPVETRYPIEYGHDSLIRRNSYENLLLDNITNQEPAGCSKTTASEDLTTSTTMSAVQQRTVSSSSTPGPAIETVNYTPVPGSFYTGTNKPPPPADQSSTVVVTESQSGPNFDYLHVTKTQTTTTRSGQSGQLGPMQRLAAASATTPPATSSTTATSAAELDQVLGQLLTENQQTRSQSRGSEFAAENTSLKPQPAAKPRLIVEEHKQMMPDKLPYKVGISMQDTRSARAQLSDQHAGSGGAGVRPAGAEQASTWLEQQQLKLIAKREGADWLRRHEGEKQVVAELKGLINSGVSSSYQAQSQQTMTTQTVSSTQSKLRKTEQTPTSFYAKSRSVSEMSPNLQDNMVVDEKASQAADYFRTINSALDRLIRRSTSQNQIDEQHVQMQTPPVTLNSRRTPVVVQTTSTSGVASPTPSQPPKPVTYTVTVTPQSREAVGKHEYFVKTASRQEFVHGEQSSAAASGTATPQAVIQRVAVGSTMKPSVVALQRSQSTSSALTTMTDRSHPWRSQTPGPVTPGGRIPVPVILSSHQQQTSMTNKLHQQATTTVTSAGQKCLSPVIHSSQMGTENLPSPRTLYIPATRRTETTTKHIIVSTETKRKKPVTNEAGAQTESRETHATQTTPVDKEYEDIMLLKPIGRGLHNLEPDQQTFLRPTTPQAFARPFTPGMSGYATLDSAGNFAGYASSSAVSRSRSMQGIAGYPTMLRSPSAPINDGSPYIRQPLGSIVPSNMADSGTNGAISLVPAASATASASAIAGITPTSRVVREQESEQSTTMHKEFRDGPYILRNGTGPNASLLDGTPGQYFMLSDQPAQQNGGGGSPGSTLPRAGSEHNYSSVQRINQLNSQQQQASPGQTQTSSISINHPIHVDIYSGTLTKQDQSKQQDQQTTTIASQTVEAPPANAAPPPTPKFPTQQQAAAAASQSTGTMPRFVSDSSRLWYRPNISRDEAITLLKNKAAGTFLIRDSNTFKGAYGLAIKVNQLPANVQPKPGGDPEAELVRHFLIERTAGGVRLKGCANEPVFPSLAALVYQHSITPLALPCMLILPAGEAQQTGTLERQRVQHQDASQDTNVSSKSLLDIGAACNVVYLGTVDCESLSGPRALGLAVTQLLRQTQPESRSTQVHFKVNAQGVTLTDNIRRLFFRRHYPPQSVVFCGIDPENRKFVSANKAAPCDTIFGFVARRQPGQSTADNQCHVFAELDPGQPAQAVVDFINSQLLPLAGNQAS